MQRIGWVMLIVIALTAAGLSRWSFVNRPFDPDGALFVYMGRMVSEGGLFGRDLIDNKPATVGAVTQWAWEIARTDWRGYVLIQLGLSILSACSVGLAACAMRRDGEARWTRVAAGVAVGLVLLNLQPFVFGGFQTETLQIFFTSLSGAVVVWVLSRCDRGELQRAGALACLSVLIAFGAALLKPSGLAVAGALGVVLVLRWRVGGWMGAWMRAGWCVGMLLGLLGWIWIAGRVSVDGYTLEQMREASRYAAGSAWDGFAVMKIASVLAGVMGVIGVAVLLGRKRVGTEHAASVMTRAHASSDTHHSRGSGSTANDDGGGSKRVMVFLWVWLLLEIVGVVLQKRMYAYHFLPIMVPGAMLAATMPRRVSVRAIVGAMILPLAISVPPSIELLRAEPARRLAISDELLRRADLRADIDAEQVDRVWMDGYARLLIETGMKPASRVPLTFLFINDDQAAGRYVTMLLEDLRADRGARYVVLPESVKDHVQMHVTQVRELVRYPVRAEAYAEAWGRIERFVEAGYSPVWRGEGVVLWERRDVVVGSPDAVIVGDDVAARVPEE